MADADGRTHAGTPSGGDDADGLVASGLRLCRGGRIVLQDADLAVPRGCVTALTAPSGAGKSTILRCLTRLLDPDEGSITLAGTDIRSIPPRALRRRVGLVAQHPVMLPGTVSTNVGHGLASTPGDARSIAVALEAAGLDGGWGDRNARELSGGEQARVAIARAVVLEPEILLLDEPTAALDARAAALIGATLQRLAGDGIGVCIATHDLAFAARYAYRTVHLDRAR